jgi:hypothetical protein
MAQDVTVINERIIREGVVIILQKVHYKNLKKIVTRELDSRTGIPTQIVQIMHILQLEDEPVLARN